MVDVTGKKLGAALSLLKRKDKETIFYLGSSSGYLVIGTAKEIDKVIDSISSSWGERYSAEYNRIMSAFLPLAEDAIWDRFEDPLQYADKLVEIGNKVKAKSKVFRRVIDLYKGFRPMRDRPIAKCYELTRAPGIALIIPGSEIGPYWTKEEWDTAQEEEKHGNKKN